MLCVKCSLTLLVATRKAALAQLHLQLPDYEVLPLASCHEYCFTLDTLAYYGSCNPIDSDILVEPQNSQYIFTRPFLACDKESGL